MSVTIEDKCACVILNYNDASTTIDLVKRIKDYSNIGDIIIVDNNSSDNSLKKLQALIDEHIHILALQNNGGYGSGNNKGIEYANHKLNYRYVLISNPDVYFSSQVVDMILEVFKNFSNYALLSPVQVDNDNQIIQDFAWKLPSINQFIFLSELFLGKTFQGYHYSANATEMERIEPVDCVPGAFLGLDCQKFHGFYYDEDFFLYCEEMVIASMIKKNGYQTGLLSKERYQHAHSVSINKSIVSVKKQRRILTQSRMLFLKKYLNASRVKLLLGLIMFKISDVEAIINEKYKKNNLGVF